MTKEQLNTLLFTKEKDIVDNHGTVEGMDYQTLLNFDNLCLNLQDYGCKAIILDNGLNSGDHVSESHKKGEAIDFTIDKDILLFTIIVLMVRAGFNGIGVYYNGNVYSFHGDIGSIRQWVGFKKKGEKQWHPYLNLVNDPKQFTK